MIVPPVTVFKLGGSLLDLPDLAARLRAVLPLRSEEWMRLDNWPLLVVGGGAAADLVRDWDRVHGLGDEAAHWLAIEAMRLNESLVARLLPESRIVFDLRSCERAWREERLPILCAAEFLRAEERAAGETLPRSWDVTSDSIAAWVAWRWAACELILLKSTECAEPGDSSQDAGVDPWFVQAVRGGVSVGWINLRSASPRVVPWGGAPGAVRSP